MAEETKRESLGSRLGFILLSAGCAIGLGNVWRFPYITGKNGGAAFVLIYLVFLVILGLPVMVMEFSIGRASRKNIGLAMKELEPKGTKWHIYGPFAVAGNYILMMFYTVIAGWILYYMLHSGAMLKTPSGEFFNGLLASPWKQALWMVIVVALGMIVCSLGLEKGVEKITKVVMLALFALMLVLAIHSCTIEGSGAGLKFYLVPDFKKMTEVGIWTVITEAMNQAFFTLSLGIGSMEIFGSYIGKENSLPGESVRIIALDTFVALMSGLIIFPACFAYGTDPGSGPGLLFVTLPTIFQHMKGGEFWGFLFFLFMSFAAMSTVVAVFENIINYWQDSHGWSRRKACLINCFAIIALAIPCLLGFNAWAGFQPLGSETGVLDLEDFLVSSTLLPFGSLLFVLFCTTGKGWGWKNFIAEANTGRGMKFKDGKPLRIYISYVLPLIIIAILIKGYFDVFSKLL
ncbi:MAG: sodium-dependent transporter [Sphaerochaetaceae bacterium]|jgi:NSS family neurotransmitter:Na+ symporter|nr:sodium-dependent transporter [Sphaerochaetaceae bacterium]MDD4397186.1 sodium-dependent transporter [Sphaerochaetaceae bacterium]